MTTLRLLGCALLLAAGCGAPPPPPPAAPAPAPPPAAPLPPEKVAADTGKPCAKAQALCDGGLCTVDIDNACDQPVSCDMSAAATCKTDAEMIEATGRGRGTIAAKSKGQLTAAADCTRGKVMMTQMKDLHCH